MLEITSLSRVANTGQVYYHLGSYDDALLYALGAEELFDVNERSEYVDTMIGEHLSS